MKSISSKRTSCLNSGIGQRRALHIMTLEGQVRLRGRERVRISEERKKRETHRHTHQCFKPGKWRSLFTGPSVLHRQVNFPSKKFAIFKARNYLRLFWRSSGRLYDNRNYNHNRKSCKLRRATFNRSFLHTLQKHKKKQWRKANSRT